MKNRSKALVLCICTLALIVSGVFTTLAYLTSTDEVVNTFTVGNVAITLDEADVNTDGTPIEGAPRVQENEYHLLPGHTYTKDPTVHIADTSEEAYLIVTITIDDNADLQTALNKYNLSNDLWDLLEGSVQDDWSTLTPAFTETEDDSSKTYYLTYKTTIDGDTDDIVLFKTVTVPDEFTNDDLATLDNFKITVNAYAVQVDGLASAQAAWDATFGAPETEVVD